MGLRVRESNRPLAANFRRCDVVKDTSEERLSRATTDLLTSESGTTIGSGGMAWV